jgi:hypothetical protein
LASDPNEEEIHEKAQQFARLLAAEIKLYNQAKIIQGRQNKDVYRRLEKEIEKARASYDKKYGNTAAVAGDYFTKEIIRTLADNDVDLMGSGFLH